MEIAVALHRFARGQAAEIGHFPIKRFFHSHRDQRIPKVELSFHLEFWHGHDDVRSRPRLTQQLLHTSRSERLLERRKPLHRSWQQNNHREFPLLIRNLQRLERTTVEITKTSRDVHQRRFDGLCGRKTKVFVLCISFFELLRPITFEVNGVGQR